MNNHRIFLNRKVIKRSYTAPTPSILPATSLSVVDLSTFTKSKNNFTYTIPAITSSELTLVVTNTTNIAAPINGTFNVTLPVPPITGIIINIISNSPITIYPSLNSNIINSSANNFVNLNNTTIQLVSTVPSGANKQNLSGYYVIGLFVNTIGGK